MKPNRINLSTAAILLCITALSAGASDLEFDDSQSVTIGDATTGISTLYVGRYNPDNSLTITNGGTVAAVTGFIGQNSENNTIMVTGTDSSLQLSESLTVGNGTGNTLVLEDGGWVSIGATNGMADTIRIGATNGIANLSIGNGSTAFAGFLQIGTQTNESGSATLSGTGTELNISDTAYIGQSGSNNTLAVSSGASLVVSNRLEIGSIANSNNFLNINSGGKVVIVNDAEVLNPGDNAININNGGRLTYTGDANLDNAADNGFIFKSGSTLETGGELQFEKMDTGVSVILNGSLNTNLVSKWDTGTGEMYVGDKVSNNTLTIQDGAKAIAGGSTAHIGENSRNNAVNVSGTGSVFTVKGRLITGMKGDNNSLSITEGGSATITDDLIVGWEASASGNSVSVSGSNSTLTVAENAIIGAAGTKNKLTVTDAKVEIVKSLHIGKSGNENTALITGGDAMVEAKRDLLMGLASDGNKLDIEAGAQLLIGGDTLIGTNGANNTITITGTNSLLDISGYLTMGNMAETNANTGNSLSAFDTARISIGGDLGAYNGSVIKIEAGSQISVGGNYWQDATSSLSMSMSTNSIGMTNLAVAGNAYFSSNTTITVYDAGSATNEFEQVAVSSEGLFVVGSTTNNLTTELLNDTNTIQFVNHLLDIDGIVDNDNIVLKTIFLSIAEKSGLEGTSLEPVANEIDGMAQSGDANAIAMRNVMGTEMDTDAQRNKAMNDHYGEKTSAAPSHNVINMGIGGVANQLTVRGDNTRARMEAAAAAPAGAAGPHSQGQELQGWIGGYGTWGSMSAADGFNGYDADLAGFVIGVDLAVAKNVLIGLAAGSNSGSVNQDNDASGNTRTTYGALYASVGVQSWFLDGSVIYGSSSIDNTLGNGSFGTTASYDAQNIAFYLGGGKEIAGKYLIITPQASLLANYYEQDAYDEESTTAVARSVDSVDALYVQSSLGCSLGVYMAMGEVTLKPEIRAYWLHEFNASSDEDLSYTLIGGNGTPYSIGLQAPEEDIIRLGAGLAAKMSEHLELRFDLDTQQAKNYSDYTVFGSLRYQF